MPRLLDGIIGHAQVCRLLERWASQPAHGYVFYGSRHLGKRTIARRFLSALVGAPEERLAAHPDVVSLAPEEGKNTIAVELVREARARLADRPLVGSRVVLYVPDADRLNEEGVNALLKIVEEPPAGAVALFVVEDLGRLPLTLQSRLVRVPFQTVPRLEIEEALVARGLSREEAAARVERARGRPGLALAPAVTSHADAAARFFAARTLGARLATIEELTVACERAENVSTAWNDALTEWMDACRAVFASAPEVALRTAHGLMMARSFVGGPLSPRLALDKTVAQFDQPLENIFPHHISIPFAIV